ncbi:MAG: hypothetical protein U0703_21385 [Anaerolineae bacterium]
MQHVRGLSRAHDGRVYGVVGDMRAELEHYEKLSFSFYDDH